MKNILKIAPIVLISFLLPCIFLYNTGIANETEVDIAEPTNNVAIEETFEEEPELPQPTPKSAVSVIAVGDIHMGRGVEHHLNRTGRSGDYVFDKVREMITANDVAFANIEDPMTDSTQYLSGKINLKMPPRYYSAVKNAGFNLLSLANNHILDYYEKGLYDTIELLKGDNLAYAGAGRDVTEARQAAIIEKNGVKIGLLAYTELADIVYAGNPSRSFEATNSRGGVAPLDYDLIAEDVARLRGEVDILFVSLHWGVEYEYFVSDYQIELAHKIMDNLGVDAIIGSHPHRMKGIEIYNGKPIMYSLGNFISDQNDPKNQEGFFVQMVYEDGAIQSLEAIPFKIEGKMQVVPVYGQNAQYLLNNQKRISEQLGDTRCEIVNDRLIFVLD